MTHLKQLPNLGSWTKLSVLIAKVYVYSLNVHRRHLEYDQRVALAVIRKQEIQASGIVKPGRPVNSSDFGGITEQKSTPKAEAAGIAATELKVGRNAVYEAEKVQQEAPELFEVMLDGGIKLRPAVRECEERKRRALAVFPSHFAAGEKMCRGGFTAR